MIVAVNLVEADQALEQLLAELKTLKSSSEQLQEAEKTTTQAAQSAAVVAALTAEVLEATNRQTQSVTQLAQEVQTQMTAVRRAANVNRWLTVIVLLLAGANVVLAYLAYQALLAL